jgi:NADPH:quinone reductase
MTTNPAVVATAYGEPDVLTLIDAERPVPGPGQVLIEVRAAGINPLDHKLYSGAFGADPAALPMRLGLEVAGVVAEIGPDDSDDQTFAVGDAVLANGVSDGYAAFVVADRADVFAKPDTLSFEEASGLLVTGGTAVDLLTATRVQAGDTVLVHGVSGAVGSLVVQLATAKGARVIGTARPERHDEVRALGGEPVAYGPGLLERVRELAPGGIDVALDAVGTDEAIDTSAELVADRTRIATIANFGKAPALGIQVLTGGGPSAGVRAQARQHLIEAAGAGTLTVKVDRSFALGKAGDAHSYLKSGKAQGRLALIP